MRQFAQFIARLVRAFIHFGLVLVMLAGMAGLSGLSGGGLMFAIPPAMAVEPDEILKDPKLEARARKISKGLRCLVCQNESIDDSNADLAKDLRVLLRERLVKGDSDEQAVQYIVDRYGEFVLLQPRFSPYTFVLWFGPLAALLLAGYYLYTRPRLDPGAKTAKPQELSEEERKRLAKLLDEN
jgi:cytochrome c-type biogenesis protein CcmH